MHTDVDVIIIGAGPAGLMAAQTLSTIDADYLVIDRDSAPGENKPCGGFLPMRALREFGITPRPEWSPVRSIRMKFPTMDAITVEFEEVEGYNIARRDLGTHLLQRVAHHQDHVRMNSEVTGISIDSDGCRVTIKDNDSSNVLSCKLILDCSGANPVSTKTSLVRDRLPSNAVGYANQFYFERDPSQPPFEQTNEFYYGSEFSPHGYAWIFPRGHVTVVGTGGLVSEIKKSEKRLEDYLNHLVYECEPAKSELQNARLIKRDAALMPLAGVVRPSFSERIMLAGDAAAHCSPITGEGIYYSMIGGQLAAETAINALAHNDFSRKRLGSYERAWSRKIGSDLKWGLWLQKRLMHGDSSGMAASLLTSEKNSRIVAEMLLGNRSVLGAIFAIAPSYVRSKILNKIR
ncbi:MAG: NAD(P)/FAD-dependent oxidoreductase [Candidatus Thorarchaeota archaeon]|nr:NAD(P)/FAD-dependent oxidoreductase [Candidatus Thorarchaeota archaeon]